jgi:tetratricopeptide (TPR) repeat protein
MNRLFLRGLVFFFVLALPFNLMAADFLKEADALHERGGIEDHKQSIDLYLKALDANPNDYGANWKCARAYRTYADKYKKKKLEGWEDLCAKYGKKGMEYAQKAIEIDPGKADAHYYYGLSVGIYSDGVSILTALSEGLKGKTENAFETAYKIDKMYNEAGPMLSLARFWAVLPWPMKDKKASLKFYREYQATPYFATSDDAPIFLAELLLDMGGKQNKAEATALLEKAAQNPDPYFSDWAKRLLK